MHICAFLGLSMLLCGCSLEEQVFSNSTRHTYYKTEMQVRSGLSGLYGPARTIYVNSGFWQMTECTTDLMSMSVSTQYNANCDVSPSRPAVASTVWSNGYDGVMRCNEIIDVLKCSEAFTEEEKLPWIAEAVVMRAFYYYILTSTFGNVPFYTEAVNETNRAHIASLPRMSAHETREYLIDELMEYLMPESEDGKAALPYVRTYESASKAYAGAAVGLMIAGKLCLWNGNYADAVKVFGQLENIYGHYRENKEGFRADYRLSDVRWSEKFVKESILEVGNTVEDFGLVIKGSIAPWCMPLRTTLASASEDIEEDDGGNEEVSNIYNGIVIPELGGYARTYTAALPTSYYYTSVLRYTDGDLRNGEYSNGRGLGEQMRSSGNLAWRWPGTGYVDAKTEAGLKVNVLTEKEGIYWFNKPSNSAAGVKADANKPYGNNQPWLGNKFWCFNMHNNNDGNNYKIFRFAGVLLNLAEAHLMLGDSQKACDYLNIVRYRACEDVESFRPITLASVGGNQEALMEEIRMECARELFGEFQRKFDLVRWGIWYERASMYNEGKYIRDYMQPYHEYWPIPAEQITYSGGALDNDAYKNQE